MKNMREGRCNQTGESNKYVIGWGVSQDFSFLKMTSHFVVLGRFRSVS
jgi:hypothetical protein